jgi:hypothetical protein
MKRHEQFMKDAQSVGSPEDYPPSADVDMVNSPPHYNQSGIECIQAIQAALGPNFKYYLQGSIMKYLWRFEYKDKPIEDLDKADWYLGRLREEVVADAS